MNHYEIKMIDTDPDTGEEKELVLAISSDEYHAAMIVYSLNQTSDYSPNREFKSVKVEKETWQ